jgi:dihydrolipoamide dehydrogenase
MRGVTSVVIVGGGPGGYEAALVGRQLGAEVTLIDSGGIGGSAVLTDCVPSKALITTANVITAAATSAELGVLIDGRAPHRNLVGVDLAAVNQRIKSLAAAQSTDIQARLESDGVTIVRAHGRLDGHTRVIAEYLEGGEQSFDADVVLLATGARPRILEGAEPDGERILNWEQVYDLTEVPESLIVVGAGVTGAEFAGAFQALGSHVTLVSSRDRVLPSEDPDAAQVVEDVYSSMGMHLLPQARAVSAT